MSDTILERIQDGWRHVVPEVDNARNIAEALRVVSDYRANPLDMQHPTTSNPRTTSIAEALLKCPNEKANTILEHMQEWYGKINPDTYNAKNIAETTALFYETGGVGAGSIRSVLYKDYTFTFLPNGGEGKPFTYTFVEDTYVNIPECPFTPPEGKQFAYWILENEDADDDHLYPGPADYGTIGDRTLLAGWVDAE